MKPSFLVAALPAAILLYQCGFDEASRHSRLHEAWNPANDPLRLSGQYVRKFSELPLEGSLADEDKPWSDTYWPSSEGGIAARWSGQIENGFDYQLATLDEVRAMTPQQVKDLSPAEKYDIYMGRFDYPTVKSERLRTSPQDEGWWGLCHGWAPASLLFREPSAVVMKSSDGIEIPFGSSDIKALLTYHQGQIANVRSSMLGERCNEKPSDDEELGTPRCRDVNAGSFQVVIANQLGKFKKGFVIDRTRDYQVWNQPVFAFKTKILSTQGPSEGAASGTVKELIVDTLLSYTVETGPHWERMLGTDMQADSTESFSYRIELNEKDEIIGGEWMEWSRPDFIWQQEKGRFNGYFKGLDAIVKAAGGI